MLQYIRQGDQLSHHILAEAVWPIRTCGHTWHDAAHIIILHTMLRVCLILYVPCGVADLGRFTQMLLDGGRVGSKQIVPAAFVEDSLTSTDTLKAAMNGNFYGLPWPGAAFHNTFFLDPSRKALYNYGAFGNLLYVDYDASTTCVLLSAWEKPNDQIQEWMSALQQLVSSL